MMPSIFLNHGGGPLPLLGDQNHRALVKYLSKVANDFPKPQAILIASAHWETSVTSFVGSETPPLLYDYYGFPKESYSISYPARNALHEVEDARRLLERAGISSKIENRGYDHGVFVPLKLVYPEADIPVVEMSLPSTRDPSLVMKLGEALRPLREKGILLIGSGLSFHNLQAFFSEDVSKKSRSTAFDQALKEGMTSADRIPMLKSWESLPHARYCHPNEDHLMPLLFVAGSAFSEEPCRIVYEDVLMGAKISGFAFMTS